MNIRRIYIEEIETMLGRGRRYADSWCRKKNLQLLKEGNRKFTWYALFIHEYDSALIEALKIREGHNWRKVYEKIKDGQDRIEHPYENKSIKTFEGNTQFVPKGQLSVYVKTKPPGYDGKTDFKK